MKGRLFLLPATLGGDRPEDVIPPAVFGYVAHVRHFAVEELRSARRFLSSVGFRGMMDSLEFYPVNEHSSREDIESAFSVLLSGHDMALVSEAGLPAVADPGAALVGLAHAHGVEVVPFSGPSSLMMALMSSGMNGQRFSFHGYVPVNSARRKEKIRDMETVSARLGETEIFIETPYRNDSLLKDILDTCRPGTMLCVAAGLTLPEQFIRTKSIEAWRKEGISIGRRPCVFLLQAGNVQTERYDR